MQCHHHPEKESIAQCVYCEQHLCRQCAIPRDKGFLCSGCVAVEAAKETTDGIDHCFEGKRKKAEIRNEREQIKKVLWHAWQWGIVVIGLCVLAYQAADLINVLNDKKPIRKGTYNTDEKTDDCIRNLLEVAKLLQQGNLPGDDLVCPASQKAFLITEENEDVVARSPNPELYGFKEIRVSKKKPIPELIRY
jgi:hypothetical protein